MFLADLAPEGVWPSQLGPGSRHACANHHCRSRRLGRVGGRYPYTAGATTLSAALPPSALSGGEPALRRRLSDPRERARIARLIEENREKSLDDLIFGRIEHHPELGGRRLVEVAAEQSIAPSELLLRTLEESGVSAVMMVAGLSETDVRYVLGHPRAVFGSDGWVMSADREPYAHPRNFAAAVRLLAHYVRDEGVLSIRQAVAMLTSLPARRFGLADRGRLTPGAAADIAVIDLEAAVEVSDFTRPCQYPRGIRHVVVNGQIAVENGMLTGIRAGKVLLRKAS
jgi:N-acyl-D-amino-acid deacylase